MAVAAMPTIPTPLSMSYDLDGEGEKHQKAEQSKRLWDWLGKLRRHEQNTPSNESQGQGTTTPPQTPPKPASGQQPCSRKVGIGIPRSTTFTRQLDENRKNLEPVQPAAAERRQLPLVRLRALSSSPQSFKNKRPKRETSAPDLGYHTELLPSIDTRIEAHDWDASDNDNHDQRPPPPPPPQSPPAADDGTLTEASYDSSQTVDAEIQLELEKKWILNLSMHFRDKSPREKFFVTYAQTPQKWRRVTVSCDYRNVEVDSLEADLQAMASQREKSARVYESLRDSLADIQFYDTVTNLKLETRDERLHVHVTEDVNEIIAYPPMRCIQHLSHVRKFKESELHFVEHMSGFVYKVGVVDNTWIKKEIPGPDSVDEFLYEINALSHLTTASHVIELKGLAISDDESLVKGVLIAFAEKNALVDIIYDNRGNLPWARRERWARQIIKGLSEIHEAGFVQGDFTLSNIVIDGNDEAQIIDINRRGCPVGWEPPEIAQLIASGQRISMFIGIKSDLFQLGMVLWALAMEEDEPERQARPLNLDNGPEEIPGYYRGLVDRCLANDPVMRAGAKGLLREFPASVMVSGSFDESMPELKPAQNFPSVPIVKGSPNRADAGPKSHSSIDKDIGKVAPAPSSKQTSNERLGRNEQNYTEMLARTAESTERERNQIPTTIANGLIAPPNRETGNTIEAQPSSSDPDPTTNLPNTHNCSAASSAKADLPKYSPTRNQPTDTRQSSSLSPRPRSQYATAGQETVLLESSTEDPSWDAITGDRVSPYEIPQSALDTDDAPPLPPYQRRASHFDGIPSPPPHGDSGLADIDTPRTSAELAPQYATHTAHRHSTGSNGPTPADKPANGNNDTSTDLARQYATHTPHRHSTGSNGRTPTDNPANGNNDESRRSDERARRFQHVGAGIGDMDLAGIGSGLSFKERARQSGIIAPGLADELEMIMKIRDEQRENEVNVEGEKV